jgi:hypothetical protein
MRRALLLTAALAIGCSAAQHATGSGEEIQQAFTRAFPSEPYEYQLRPGKDGKCSARPSSMIVRGGGCWAPLGWSKEKCEAAADSGQLHVFAEGECWYPVLDTRLQREPTSSLFGEGRP